MEIRFLRRCDRSRAVQKYFQGLTDRKAKVHFAAQFVYY
jgi:hypothetical protein